MNILFQFSIILLISLAGEALSFLIPLPIPASIYGILLLFLLYGWEKSICLSFNCPSSLQFVRAKAGLSSRLHHRSLGYLWTLWKCLMPICPMNE